MRNEMTEKIEISPEELNEIVKAQVAEALAAERNPKPLQPEERGRMFDEQRRAEIRASLVSQGARWAAFADDALEAAVDELRNPSNAIVGRLSVTLPDRTTKSPPDFLGIAASMLELRAQRDPEFAAEANAWFRLEQAGDLYRRPALFRALCEQRFRLHSNVTSDTTTPTETNTKDSV